MMKKRGLAIMLSAFAVVLLGGVAVAQIANVLPKSGEAADAPPLAATSLENDTPAPADVKAVTTPEKERADAPKDEPTDRVKDDEKPAADEPKDEPPVDEKPSITDEKPSITDEKPDTTPPEFVILSPEDGAHVDDEVITVAGEVEPGAVVSYGDKYRAEVSDDGRWRIALKLAVGKNTFTLFAMDEAGNKSAASVTVYLDRKTDHRFTAHQKWEIVDGSPTANKYYGTATPGAAVYIVSEKGGAHHKVTAGANGEWEAYVEFPKASCNEWFGVVVETDGGRATFEMKWLCERDHEFSAHQKWEVVDGTPAANKYYGTSVPRTHVWIVSAKGGAEHKVTVGANGEWDAYVEFPKAPCNTPFGVVVEAEGGRTEFTMKWVCPDAGDDVDFTAHQQYTSCDEAIPYDVFWGTEDADADIWVESDYGSGWTTANEHGEWELTVEFPTSPVGKTFNVTVTSSDGGKKVFKFTHTSAGDK